MGVARLLLIGALFISLSPPAVMVASIASSDDNQASSSSTLGTEGTEAPPTVAPSDLTADAAQEAADKLASLADRTNRFLMRFKKVPLTEGVPNEAFASAAADLRKAFTRWSKTYAGDAYDSDTKVARAYEATLKRVVELAGNPSNSGMTAYNQSVKKLQEALRG